MPMIEHLSAAMLRVLPRKQFLQVRNGYIKLKAKAAPLLRLIHGTFTTQDLIAEIDHKVDKDWSVLMVHSSMNGLEPMYEGSAMELLKALIDYCGPDRTLVMPAFYFGEGGEGTRVALKRNPRFDLRRTPSQMGLLTELFRRTPGAVQSLHPAYRVAALGPEAEALVQGHENTAGMGAGSPFDYMARHNAQIVGIGKTFQVMTQVHHVESLLGDDWPGPQRTLQPIPVTIVTRDGEVGMEFGGTERGGEFNVWKLRLLLPPERLREWSFHNCPMFAARAGEVTDALLEGAMRGIILYDL